MMLIIPSRAIKIHAGISRFTLSAGPGSDGLMPALSPNRIRLQKIDSISASCLRMAGDISATGERLESLICQPFDSVAEFNVPSAEGFTPFSVRPLTHVHDRAAILKPDLIHQGPHEINAAPVR